MTTMKYWRIFD